MAVLERAAKGVTHIQVVDERSMRRAAVILRTSGVGSHTHTTKGSLERKQQDPSGKICTCMGKKMSIVRVLLSREVIHQKPDARERMVR